MNKINNYRVLARKYRPKVFNDLVGQDVLVKTLGNAISENRIYHAFMLTGMRGVGKTTTARIIARSLNCVELVKDKEGNLSPCGKCEQCNSIDIGNNVDVIEIDAASNTGVSNIREIIDNVRYKPVSSKYKVYVIDEVHMLSNAAFNALLKTLEEPPPNVVFILATTEIRKVPITVLSRCQRFDLKRITSSQMVLHLKSISSKENVEIEETALDLISSASEGSVRDGLSLLDQAMSFCGQEIKEIKIRDMLGLSGRAQMVSLFFNILKGEIKAALENTQVQYSQGVDASVVIQELMDLCHWVTKYKITKNDAEDITIGETERIKLIEISESISFANLTRIWQMLLKGLDDVNRLSSNSSSLEMVIIRTSYASHLPDPGAVIKSFQADKKKILKNNDSHINNNLSEKVFNAQASIETAENFQLEDNLNEKQNHTDLQESDKIIIDSFADLISVTEKKDEFILRSYLLSNVHVISFEHGKFSLRIKENTPKNFIGQLSIFLTNLTGIRWLITLSDQDGQLTVREKEESKAKEIKKRIEENPVISYALDSIPGSEVKSINEINDSLGLEEKKWS